MGYNLGVIGTGGFTHFSVKAFDKVAEIHIIGAFDTDVVALQKFCEAFHCKAYASQEALLETADIHLVYIASPPFLHYPQSRSALLAGKHVICEKPAALQTSQVEELIRLAKDRQLLYVVNLMQRYNPLFGKVQEIIRSKLLGAFLHGYFENYAADESLEEEHWMWDERKSGGIFLEHAVHFFDLVEGWLGEGQVIAAQKVGMQGREKKLWPEVQAICKYRNGLFNFYHGFHQANRMDRQELKLVFETGDITLHEWVPSRLVLHGLVTDEVLRRLVETFPDGRMKIIKSFVGKEKAYRNRAAIRRADHLIHLESGDDANKLNNYEDLLTNMMADQVEWLKDRTHQRKITEANAIHSVEMAENAEKEAIRL
jgi:predicted dehydrogenase